MPGQAAFGRYVIVQMDNGEDTQLNLKEVKAFGDRGNEYQVDQNELKRSASWSWSTWWSNIIMSSQPTPTPPHVTLPTFQHARNRTSKWPGILLAQESNNLSPSTTVTPAQNIVTAPPTAAALSSVQRKDIAISTQSASQPVLCTKMRSSAVNTFSWVLFALLFFSIVEKRNKLAKALKMW